MMSLSSPVLAETGQSLLDNHWVATFVILGSATAFLHAIIAFRSSLAKSQPDKPSAPKEPTSVAPAPQTAREPAPAVEAIPSAEIFAAIAAAVAVTFGGRARIAAVQPAMGGVAIDQSRLQWSAEGRRQIYSSHKVR
jgi:hypothetical protein